MLNTFDYLALSGLHTLIAFVPPLRYHLHAIIISPLPTIPPSLLLTRIGLSHFDLPYALFHPLVALETFPDLLYLCRLFYHRYCFPPRFFNLF